jgi:hypothetical protein
MQVAALSGLAVLVGAAAPAGATAQPQVFHTKVSVSLLGIDICGFTVNSVIEGVDTTQVFVDPAGNVAIHDQSHVVDTITNLDNGKVAYVDNASRDFFTPDGVVNPDGTVTFTDTLTGMPIRVYTSHSSVLLADVGLISTVTTIDADGNLVSEQVTEDGSHPFTGDQDVFCTAITAAIG